MTEEEIAMIEWLKNASETEILSAMASVEKEIFRESVNPD